MSDEIPQNRATLFSLKRAWTEAPIIIVSILLALGADAWWDGIREAEAERVILLDLKAELDSNVAALEMRWFAAHEQVLDESLAVLLGMYDFEYETRDGRPNGPAWGDSGAREWYVELMSVLARSPDLMPTSLATNYQLGSILRTPSYGPELASLDVLFTAGALGRLRNPELRVALSALPAILEDVNGEEVLVRDVVYNSVGPQFAVAAPNVAFPSGVFPGDMVEWPQGAPDFVHTFRPTPELARSMAKRIQLTYVILQELGLLHDRYLTILELIDQEIS